MFMINLSVFLEGNTAKMKVPFKFTISNIDGGMFEKGNQNTTFVC